MRDRSAFFAACCIAATALAVLVGGCNSSESQARAAYDQYQTAMAAGDLTDARDALRDLLKIKDDDPTYWEALGQIQLQLGSRGGAYYAFTRAHELDSSNVSTVATLTQIALSGDNLDAAEKHANELELLAPGHPASRMANGYISLQRQDYDKADEQADALLQAFPFDSNAKLLKARIFLGRKEPDKAIALLEEQVKTQPDDAPSLKALMLLYERQNNWAALANAANRLHKLNPRNMKSALTFIEASLRSNAFANARRASESLLAPNAPSKQVDDVLKLWAEYWKRPEAVVEARKLASSAALQHRLAYATYFNEVDQPDDAAALVGETPKLPLNRTNLSLNSVIATSLALKGERAEAKRLFDAILSREPDHVYALRGRINVEITTGNAKGAISDAQRLVSIEPDNARDRLLLARAFAAAGDSRQVDRTLWDAFHEIPADFETYEALRAHVQRTAGADDVRAVDEEFQQQRDVALARDFI